LAAIEQRNMAFFEKRDQGHARQKATDMRHIGNAAAARIGQGLWHSNKLTTNPNAQNQPRRQVDKTNKDDDQQKTADCGFRVKQ
jgi:hypothetical protein